MGAWRSRSGDDGAAVDVDHLAGDPAAVVGDQHGDAVGDILRRAEALHGGEGDAEFAQGCGVAAEQHGGIGHARRNGIDGDAARPQFPRQDLGEALHRHLAADIQRHAAWIGSRGAGGDIHDAALVLDLAGRFAAHHEGAAGIGVESVVVMLHRNVGKGLHVADAGIVDDDVDAAVTRPGGGEEGDDVFFAGDIDPLRKSLAARAFDRRHGGLGAFCGARKTGHHGKAVSGQAQTDGLTDTRAATADDGDPLLGAERVQTTSNSPAAPMPPPMHIETTT